MKFPLIGVLLFATLTLSAQLKQPESKSTDTLTLPESTKARFVKIGKETYALEKMIPGVFCLNFNADYLNTLFTLLECSGTQLDVAKIKTLLTEQLKSKGLLK